MDPNHSHGLMMDLLKILAILFIAYGVMVGLVMWGLHRRGLIQSYKLKTRSRAMAKGDYEIPFDLDGNQLSYPESWKGVVWRDNVPFDGTLVYAGYSRGRSSALIEFLNYADGKRVSMFMTDFDKAARRMTNGMLSGRFRYVKRGQNYGIQLVEE